MKWCPNELPFSTMTASRTSFVHAAGFCFAGPPPPGPPPGQQPTATPMAAAAIAALFPNANSAATTSTCLRIMHMLNAEILADAEELKEVLEAVKEECEEHGTGGLKSAPRVVKQDPKPALIVVDFVNRADAVKAKAIMSTRTFDGQQLIVEWG